MTPEEFGAYFKREVDKYAKVIKAAGAQVDWCRSIELVR
jgi:tripartite-type tricarboxylate transporter receptor subunit TctC